MRVYTPRIAALGAAALVLAAAACATDGSSTDTSPVATWGAEAAGQPRLTLAKEGTLSGTDGCNQLIGGWKQDGSTVTFTAVASTKMMCVGVDTWLSNAASASIKGTSMTVMDKTGATIGTLEQAKE